MQCIYHIYNFGNYGDIQQYHCNCQKCFILQWWGDYGHVHIYKSVLWTLEKLRKTSFCHEMINFSARQGVIVAVFEIGSQFWAQKSRCPNFDELEKKNKASIYRKCQYIWLLLQNKYFIFSFFYKQLFSPRLWNTGLVSSGASLASWEEGSSLALVGHASSDGVTIKMPYGVDVLYRPASHPIFSY